MPSSSQPEHRPAKNSLANLILWKDGQSGNPHGRPTEQLRRLREGTITDALIRYFELYPLEFTKFIVAAVRKAQKGNVAFWQAIADRVEGPVVRRLDVTGTVRHEITDAERVSASKSLEIIAALDSDEPAPIQAEYAGETDVTHVTESPAAPIISQSVANQTGAQSASECPQVSTPCADTLASTSETKT